MVYQIHIMKKGDDGIFCHIPLYFLTTKDYKVAKENFKKVVDNFFWGEKYPEIKEYSNSSTGQRMTATGENTARYNLCGTYIIEIFETFEDCLTEPII